MSLFCLEPKEQPEIKEPVSFHPDTGGGVVTGDTRRATESVMFKRPVKVLQDLNFKWRAAEDSNSRPSDP